MRLDWSRDFVGEGHNENPYGLGIYPEMH